MRLVSEQVKILLERMETHSEEFCKGLLHSTGVGVYGNKWDIVLTGGEFNPIEKFLLRRKMKNIRRKVTQQQILMTIMYGQEEEDDSPRMSTASRFNTKPRIRQAKDLREEYERYNVRIDQI